MMKHGCFSVFSKHPHINGEGTLVTSFLSNSLVVSVDVMKGAIPGEHGATSTYLTPAAPLSFLIPL